MVRGGMASPVSPPSSTGAADPAGGSETAVPAGSPAGQAWPGPGAGQSPSAGGQIPRGSDHPGASWPPRGPLQGECCLVKYHDFSGREVGGSPDEQDCEQGCLEEVGFE